MKLKSLIFLVFLAIFARTNAFGQKPTLLFHHLTTDEGLSESTNAYIFRDLAGFVWLSSVDGLNRFDGISVKTYREQPDDPNSIHGNIVVSPFFEDPRQNLWFSTERGLNFYHRQQDRFQKINLLADPTNFWQHNVFCLDSEGFLWVDAGKKQGVVRIRTNANLSEPPEKWQFSAGLVAARQYFPVLDERNGKLAFLYTTHPDSNGLMKYRNENGQLQLETRLFDGKNGLPNLNINFILPVENDQTIWIAIDSGIFQYKTAERTFRFFPKLRDTPLRQINGLAELSPNLLAMTSAENGLLIWNTAEDSLQKFRHLEADPLSISTNRLRNIYFDKEHKVLWLSSWGGGVDFTALNKVKFRNLRLSDISGDENLPQFVPGALGYGSEGIWCGSRTSRGLRLLKTDGSLIRDFSKLTGGVEDIVVSARLGTLICSENGLFQWSNGRMNPIFDGEGKAANCFNFLESRDKTFLGGLHDGGLGRIKTSKNGQIFIEKIKNPSLDTLSLGRMMEDGNGRGFAENIDGGGIFIFDGPIAGGKIFRHLKINGLVNSFCENSNYVWVGGSFGLLRIDKGTLQDSLFRLPIAGVQCVLPSGDEELWLSTTRGLFRYQLATGRLDAFERFDGLAANEFSMASGMKSPDGLLWFGGVRGILAFDPKNIKLVSNPPKIQITDILVNDLPHNFGQNTSLLNHFSLPHADNTVSFLFTAIEFSDPKNNRLRYQLFRDGAAFDSTWVVSREVRGFARYAHLDPGNYRLVIKAESSDGVPAQEPKVIDFRIEPPFWRTWQFRTLVAVLLAGALFWFYNDRLERERMKAQTALFQFEVLRSALKAHFVRNAAANLQGLMATNVPKAQLFLHRFTGLMTLILENVSKPYVRLADELELLREYLQLSALSFPEGNLKFEVPRADDLDAAGLEIPGMILQPFVENAVKHGLQPRDGQGLVSVKIFENPNHILCVVEDNGVGRISKKSSDSQAISVIHKSHSIAMNEERLKLYDFERGGKSSISILDLKDEAGNPTGTRVEIKIGF